MRDSPIFKGLSETSFNTIEPFKNTFRKHWRKVLKAGEVVALGATLNYLILIYVPTFLRNNRGFVSQHVIGLSTMALVIVIIFCVVGGVLSRFVSRRIFLQVLAAIMLVGAYPAAYLLSHGSLAEIAAVQFASAVVEGLYFGLQMTYLVNLFPTGVRVTALSVGYNLGYAVFASLPPLLAAYFVHFVAPTWVFFWLLVIPALVSGISLIARNLPQLIFIPGLCFDKGLWRYQVARFRDNYNCRVWLVNSNKLEKNCQNLLAFAHNKRFNLIAHSTLGVGVALSVAAQHPELIKKLICFPAWVAPNDFTRDFLKQSIEQVENGQFSLFKRTLRDFCVGKKVKGRAKILAQINKIQDGVPAEQMIRQSYLLLNDIDVTDELSKITADVLIVNPVEGDPFVTKEQTEHLSASLKNGMTVGIHSSGHISPYISPNEANVLIEMWLNK